MERVFQAMHAHVVFEQTIDNRVTNAIGVFGPRLDPVDLGAKGLAAGTAGAVFSYGQFDEDDFAEGNVSNLPRVGVFTSPRFSTLRARESLRGATYFDGSNTWLNSGIHACALPGLVWRPP